MYLRIAMILVIVVPRNYTEKGALSHATSKCARLDFFFKAIRGAAVQDLLQLSWSEQSLDTLKLVFQLR